MILLKWLIIEEFSALDRGFCKACFAGPLGIMYAYKAELLGVIIAMKLAVNSIDLILV